jgi:hypothetical protein
MPSMHQPLCPVQSLPLWRVRLRDSIGHFVFTLAADTDGGPTVLVLGFRMISSGVRIKQDLLKSTRSLLIVKIVPPTATHSQHVG